MNRRTRDGQSGQVLALFAFGFLAFVAAVAFVVDGGNAYSRQRISQNGSDAAAEAGATVLAQRLVGTAQTDNDVESAIDGVLTAMDMDTTSSNAVYTDIDGTPLTTVVGSLGATAPPAAAFGVAVNGDLPFDTYFARALGMNQWNAVTQATAVAGYATDQGSVILPVTPPVNILLDCENNGQPDFGPNPSEWLHNTLYVIPLCSSGPGNVGWIDWDPTAGGTSELISRIWPPNNDTPPIPLPSWQWMTETGDMAASGLESALRMWDLKTVLIPLFDDTCDQDPGSPTAPCNGTPGHGSNNWYHFPTIAAFELCGTDPGGAIPAWCTDTDGNTYGHGSYVSGAAGKSCNLNKNGTSCLVGRFVHFIRGGTVTGGLTGTVTPSNIVGVQLIK